MAALLEHLGITEEPGVDGAAVRRTGDSPLLGGDSLWVRSRRASGGLDVLLSGC